MEIRTVDKDDYNDIKLLINEFYEDSLNEWGFEYQESILKQLFALHRASSFVADKDGKVIGILAGFIGNHIISNERVYHELIWFVTKNERSVGVRLYKHMENWCKDRGIKHIVMVLEHNSMSSELRYFYTKLGYKPKETFFIKEI